MYPSLEIMIPDPTTSFLDPPLNNLVPLFFLELMLKEVMIQIVHLKDKKSFYLN